MSGNDDQHRYTFVIREHVLRVVVIIVFAYFCVLEPRGTYSTGMYI
jgi:hypothetical protein